MRVLDFLSVVTWSVLGEISREVFGVVLLVKVGDVVEIKEALVKIKGDSCKDLGRYREKLREIWVKNEGDTGKNLGRHW